MKHKLQTESIISLRQLFAFQTLIEINSIPHLFTWSNLGKFSKNWPWKDPRKAKQLKIKLDRNLDTLDKNVKKIGMLLIAINI